MKNFLFFVVLSVFALSSIAVFAADDSKKAAPAAIANEVPRDKWMDGMTTVLPSTFCKPKGFFRSCFQVNEDECIEEAVRATKACLVKFKGAIPAKLKQPKDGQEWGRKVGICSGETFEISMKMAKKEIKSAECADAGKWKE